MHDTTRSLLMITGEDAASFLQGLITQDVQDMQTGDVRFGAMLSPQGKWQHDFFVTRTADGYTLDIAENQRESLTKKLNIYKLRAKVTTTHAAQMQCCYLPADSNLGSVDPRDGRLPRRLWQATDIPAPADAISVDAYHAARTALYIPEGGIDVTSDETAMDASYDVLNAIHFTKGCYVGQEVTARMHYKQIVRKGFFGVHFSTPVTITCPTPVMAGGKAIAELRSVHGTHGIAYGKFEQAQPLLDSDAHVEVETHQATLVLPDWQVDKYARFAHEKIS